MAGVPTINGQPINASNAYNFYYDICHDKYKDQGITKDSYEASYCKRYLSSDQVEYCEVTDEQHFDAGRDELEDHEAADANADGSLENEHGTSNDIGAAVSGVGGIAMGVQAVMTSGGMEGWAQLAQVFKSAEKLVKLSSWIAAGFGLVFAALGAMSIWAISNLDPNKEARLKNEAQSENDLAAIDAKSGLLQEHISSLDADAAAYQEGQAALLGEYEENTIALATMKIDLHDAYTSGDYARASELESQIAELEANMDYDDSSLNTYWARMNDYQNSLIEADGLEFSGKNVSEFLCEGKQLKGDYLTCAISYAAAAISSALCAVYSALSIKFVTDVVPAGIAVGLFGAAAICFGVSSGIAFKGNSEEAKCQTAGEKYPGSLDPMHKNATKLSDKIKETLSAYGISSNQAEGIVNGANESGEGAVNVNNGTTAPTGGGNGNGNES